MVKKTIAQVERAGVSMSIETSETERERNFLAGKIDSVFL